MWRKGLLLVFAVSASMALKAQLKNSYIVSDNQEFDKIRFSLNTNNGQCFIEPSYEVDILDIHSVTEGSEKPLYKEDVVNRIKEVKVKLAGEDYLSSTISRRMFSSQSVDENSWKVYLSNHKPMDLDLKYAVGDMYIDLSNLPVERLKMRTGSANVLVNYKSGQENLLEMDTFLIRVDMGTLEAKNLHLSKSKNIIADVGFGKVKMDFGDAKVINTEVKATVGAGKLEVILPHDNIPVRINVNDSPLCQIIMPEGFKETTENVFVTPEFNENQKNCINFNVDVAVGNIVFKTAHH